MFPFIINAMVRVNYFIPFMVALLAMSKLTSAAREKFVPGSAEEEEASPDDNVDTGGVEPAAGSASLNVGPGE